MSPFALQSFVDKVFPPQVVDCRIFILPVRVYFVSLSGGTPTFIIEPYFTTDPSAEDITVYEAELVDPYNLVAPLTEVYY